MVTKFCRSKKVCQLLSISVLSSCSILISNGANAEMQVVQAKPVSSSNSSIIHAISNDPMVVHPPQDASPAKAGESQVIDQINQELVSDSAIETAENISSVSKLSDVRPTDWAFTALQSLVERYGCIAGYPDRTFRGNRATSRYEFALVS